MIENRTSTLVVQVSFSIKKLIQKLTFDSDIGDVSRDIDIVSLIYKGI